MHGGDSEADRIKRKVSSGLEVGRVVGVSGRQPARPGVASIRDEVRAGKQLCIAIELTAQFGRNG